MLSKTCKHDILIQKRIPKRYFYTMSSGLKEYCQSVILVYVRKVNIEIYKRNSLPYKIN